MQRHLFVLSACVLGTPNVHDLAVCSGAVPVKGLASAGPNCSTPGALVSGDRASNQAFKVLFRGGIRYYLQPPIGNPCNFDPKAPKPQALWRCPKHQNLKKRPNYSTLRTSINLKKCQVIWLYPFLLDPSDYCRMLRNTFEQFTKAPYVGVGTKLFLFLRPHQ
ncbi:hypothetical protein F4821DRAFT_103711 [Hypoxylon rubiginosum]|uniref:Uncharacterized protein n=1 Tax=Hypoxylon rubiginosum TaxID=110542 RepID=A0ACC0D5V6_9PEZI|nr:hypothetical protein F4821DRAFT_103711 [Hypoxylon rubiginosum]